MALGAITLAGCGHSDKSGAVDSDTIPEQVIAEAETSGTNIAYITKDSIGGIYIGMPIQEIPDSIDGLYSKKTHGDSPDAVALIFSDPEGERFVAYDFGEGKIDVLNLIGSDVKVKVPGGEIGIGDVFTDVMNLPGVKPEWSGYDDGGMWYWTWEGLWFAPSQDNLPMQLSQRLYHSGQAPTRNDFTDEITVGFIGTGLPF